MAVVAEEDGRSETVQELSSENDEDIEILEAEKNRCPESCRGSCSTRTGPQSSCRILEVQRVSDIEIFPPAVKLRGRLGALTRSA